LLGGGSTAALSLTVQYADLNQPQTISAPTSVKPFSQFGSKLNASRGQFSGLGSLSALAGSAL